jgi:hypothetical protein
VSTPDEGAVLDRRTLNRTLLVRQGLLERTRSGPGEMVERLVGMQAQVPRDPYIGLWSRIVAFDPESLEAPVSSRDALRMTLMRTTLHLVTAGDAGPLRQVLQGVCERAFGRSPFARALTGLDVAEVCRVGRTLLAERPLTVSELGRDLAARWPNRDPTSLAYAVRYLVPVVQVPPRGLFRQTGAPRITTLETWLGSSAATAVAPAAAAAPARDPDPAEDVIVRYLRAFGPATAADVSSWSWLTAVGPRLERLRPRLRTYRDEKGRRLFDVEDGRFADGSEPAPTRFLGEFDNLFLAHADRSRVTGDLRWGTEYARKGSIFVDGFLAGAWFVRRDGRRHHLVLEARRELSTRERRSVTEEADGLRAFLAPVAPITAIEAAWS